MRITEKRLRSIIRNIIVETNYDGLPSGDESIDGNAHGPHPLDAVHQDTGESEAERISRVAKELRKKGDHTLADQLQNIARDLINIFKSYETID